MISDKPVYILDLGELYPEPIRHEYEGKYIKVREISHGRFEIIEENLTFPDSQLCLGYCFDDENFKNLNPSVHSDDCSCDECIAGGTTHFSWKDVEFKLDEDLILAPSAERLKESLKFIGFSDWTLLDA